MVNTKGFLFIGGDKIPMPMLSEKDLIAKEKAIMRDPFAWAGTLERKKRNEIYW